jgi:hypothetical protein
MTAAAATRGRFVRLLRRVAREAARAVVARRELVRRVAARAGLVASRAVQAWAAIRGVTCRARGWRRDATGAVGAMAARARDVFAVTGTRLVRVAARARLRRLQRARVRVVTVGARRVTLRCGARLRHVARRARHRRAPGFVRATRVAVRASRVTRGHGLRVAARTRARRRRGLVRRFRVAALARRVPRAADGPHRRRVTLRAE